MAKVNLNSKNIQVFLDEEIKEKFVKLAQEEKMTITQAVETLILEAIVRGYIDKERRELLMKVKS